MRTGALLAWVMVAMAAGAVVVGLTGCTTDFAYSDTAAKADKASDAAAKSSQHMAAQLAAAMKSAAASHTGGMPAEGQTVQWINTTAQAEAARRHGDTSKAAAAAITVPAKSATVAATAAAKSRPPTTADRAQLLARLQQAIRVSDDPALAKALEDVGLSLVDANHQLDPALLASLSSSQRDLVRQYQQLVLAVGQQLAANGTGELDPDQVASAVSAIIGPQPLHIVKVVLCKRVEGFGVYDKIDSSTLLAGRDNKMIVYVELAHFKSVKDGDQYRVKLSQHIVLYNDADGLAVWKQPKVEMVDLSHNRRHDFFVVQLVSLPARLSVGKYRLKVSITDEQAHTVDEAAVPIAIVADPTLAGLQK